MPTPTPPRLKAFPVTWVTSGRTILLVGGCLKALCRLRHALAFDWLRIVAVVPPASKALCSSCCNDKRVTVHHREAIEADVEGADLIIESTLSRRIAEQLSVWSKKHGVPLNAMDKVDLCDLFYTAFLTRGPLVLSIASGGDAPALSSRLRKRLEEYMGPGWATAARLFAEARERMPEGPARSKTLVKLAQDEKLTDLIEENDEKKLAAWIDEAIRRM